MKRLLCWLELYNHKEKILVDKEDYQNLSKYRWYSDGHGHVIRKVKINGKWKNRYIHRDIMGVFDPDIIIDHINRDPLDNRRINLRIATKSENSLNSKINKKNTSGYKGVSFHNIGNKPWRARIIRGLKRIELGLYKTPEEAYRAIEEFNL